MEASKNINSKMDEPLSKCQENHSSIGGINETRHNHSYGLSLPPQDLEFRVKEFGTDENSLLLYPTHNSNNHSIWVGDALPGSSRLFEFNIATKNYTVHDLEDVNLITF